MNQRPTVQRVLKSRHQQLASSSAGADPLRQKAHLDKSHDQTGFREVMAAHIRSARPALMCGGGRSRETAPIGSSADDENHVTDKFLPFIVLYS